jgi:acyl dehydratase
MVAPSMSTTNCLTARWLRVGMRHEARFVFSREDVDRYCALSGDRNAIHRDLEAAQLRFPGVADVIVPGGLVQITITGIFGSEFPGDGSLGLTFTPERLRKPICPGDEIAVAIEITRIRGDLIEFDIAISNAEGAPIGSAKSRVLAPDDAFRRWWEQHGGGGGA